MSKDFIEFYNIHGLIQNELKRVKVYYHYIKMIIKNYKSPKLASSINKNLTRLESRLFMIKKGKDLNHVLQFN